MIRQEMWDEACELLALTTSERKLAEMLVDGSLELDEALAEKLNREMPILSPVFGHSGKHIFLNPVFTSFVNGEIPDSDNGSLPEGMTLEFPEESKLYGGEVLVQEIAEVLKMEHAQNGTGHCVVLSGKEGSRFLVKQIAYRIARPVLFWNGNTVSDQELLLTTVLYDSFTCLDLRGQQENSEKIKKAAVLCSQGADLVLLLENADHDWTGKFSAPVFFRTVSVPEEELRAEYINDFLKGCMLQLNNSQISRLKEEPFSISVLKAILGELELEYRVQRKNAEWSGQFTVLAEGTFSRVLASYKKEEADSQGIRRMTANRNLKDLSLPEEQYRKLENICAMLKNRDKVMNQWGFLQKYSYGNGISILLYGAPGTGKTMAAQVIASELHMPLYRVDLSALISKYIGETQKNIAKVFDRAKQLNGILLFDEADALFARRNEVSDAQDKYANAETAYLLQRIEESEGICILTTNLLQNFDEAFRRRITYMLHFPMPDVLQREQIWKKVFPEDAPLEAGIDFVMLAENFELSGAAIRNAAMQSAWNASVESECIRMQDILQAVENEYRKMNKALKPAQKALIELFE